ncbi:MAG: hypothetical protein AAB656_00910 [Patescibacteria group bacterium]
MCHNTSSRGNSWEGIQVDNDSLLPAHFSHGDFNYGNGPLQPNNPNNMPDHTNNADGIWCLALAQQQASPTPTPTGSSTPTPTPTPTVLGDNDVCANINGVQTSVPNGLHLDASGRNCVSFEFGGPGPNGNGGGGQVLGASTTSGQVLGASTTARAGTAEDMIGLTLIASGTILVGTSLNAYKKVYAQ